MSDKKPERTLDMHVDIDAPIEVDAQIKAIGHFLPQMEKPSFQPIEYWESAAMRFASLRP